MAEISLACFLYWTFSHLLSVYTPVARFYSTNRWIKHTNLWYKWNEMIAFVKYFLFRVSLKMFKPIKCKLKWLPCGSTCCLFFVWARFSNRLKWEWNIIILFQMRIVQMANGEIVKSINTKNTHSASGAKVRRVVIAAINVSAERRVLYLNHFLSICGAYWNSDEFHSYYDRFRYNHLQKTILSSYLCMSFKICNCCSEKKQQLLGMFRFILHRNALGEPLKSSVCLFVCFILPILYHSILLNPTFSLFCF